VLAHAFILQSSPGQRPVSSPTPRSMLVKKEFSAELARKKKILDHFDKFHSIPNLGFILVARKNTRKKRGEGI
jgi:hypothetical protein